MKFLSPNPNMKLEGFILGYGSNFFSNQYIQWPENGKSYITEVEKNSVQKPLQLVIGTLTPTSVFLSWGILINPQFDWAALNKCPNDRFYTVRYREKEKNKDWLFQLCPTTEIVIDSLKPKTMYEFGVKDNSEGGIWSKSHNHKTILTSEAMVNSFTSDSSAGTLQWVRATTDSLESQFVYSDSKTFANQEQPQTKPASREKEVYTQDTLHITETTETAAVMDFSTGMLPVSTVMPEVSSFISLEQQKTTLAVSEKQTFYDSTTESSLEKEQTQHDSRQPISEIITTEAPHTYEQEKITLVSSDTPFIPKLATTPRPETEPETTADPKTTHRVPINLIRLHIFEDPKVTLDRTEKVISPKHRKTTESLPSTAVPMTTKRMPINLIRLHIIEDPTVTSAPSETPSTPKPTQSNKMSRSKPAPKPTQRVPINVISLQIFGEPEVALVPNTTQAPSLPKTTQRTESPPSKPVPNVTQKVSPHKTKKPQPTARPRAKPASTGAPKESINPKIPHPSLEATLAPYKLQLSSSRPRTSGRPRSRPGGRAYDSTKLLGVSRNISMEQNNTGKKTFSVSSAPLLPVRPTSLRRRPLPPNVTGRPGSTGNVLMPRAPSTARPNRTVVSVAIKTPKKQPTLPPEEDIVDTTVFSPSPKSEIDSLGKTRYTAPHVKYMSKEDTVPCSITESLRHFPVEEATNHEISSAPQSPPSNLTIVTVEGCPSFVILDWEQPDNDTATEYEVISTENGAPLGKDQSIITTNQTYSTVENLKPNARQQCYEFKVKPKNPLGEGPVSTTVEFSTESADPRVSEPVTGGKDAIWTEIKFKSDSYSECKGKQYVKRTWYKKFVGIQLCNSLRYKIYLSNSLSGTFYNIGDQSGYGEDHCQFVDSFLDGRTGQQLSPDQLTTRKGFYRAVRQQSVEFGEMGGQTHIRYVHWYECGIAIPGKW
ncbi:hypothetical protein FKM82_008861 [Ascaphus truei]